MKIKRILRECTVREVPRGQFVGTWSGYVVRFQIGNYISFHIDVDEGIRGKCNCLITVSERYIKIERANHGRSRSRTSSGSTGQLKSGN